MSSAYDNLCKKLYKDIYHRLERGHDGLHFATKDTAEAVFKYENMKLFYESLTTPDFEADAQFGIGKKVFIERVAARKLHTFLTVLVYARGDILAARTFTRKLIAPELWPLPESGSSLLPAGRKWLQRFFGDEDFVTAQEFFIKQASFCAVVLRKRREIVISHPETQRLPYLEENQLAQGSFGTVFKVKIAKGHFVDPSTEPEMANTGPMYLARKDYRISDDFRAKDERDVMELISGISRSCENILENFGSIQIGATYSLFMPLAICDLKTYMTSSDFHPMRPSTTEAKADLIRCAEGLADGLKFLHSEMDGIVCYHMDLKPDNILIFRDRTRGHIWKLSDFGMARVKLRRPRDQLKGGERNFDRLFIRRPNPTEPSPSLTLNRRGEGTYMAPESTSAIPSMNTESDVWSLGCVISVLFAYFEGGSRSFQDYVEARGNHKNAQGYDRFFLRGHFANMHIHPEVRKMHRALISQAKDRSLAESSAVRSALEFLEKNVLEIDPLKRCHAHEVKVKLAETFELFKMLSDPDAGPPDIVPKREEALAPTLQPYSTEKQQRRSWGSAVKGLLGSDGTKTAHRRPSTSKRAILHENVQQWHLTKTEDFKGSIISPDGKLIVIWTERKIVLYNSTSFSSVTDDRILKAGSDYTPETSDGFWKTMSVSQKYLIACETGSNFNCYIFKLDNQAAVDANLEKWFRLTLPLPQIHKIAISANSRRLVCILGSAGDDNDLGALFYADIADLIDAAKKSPDYLMVPSATSSDGTSDISRTSDSAANSPWHTVRLKWSGADVTRLFYSGDDHIHIVVHPRITGTSRVHRLPILSLSLGNEIIRSVSIEPRGLDPSSNVELFTALAPFHKELACAVVTREKRVHTLRNPHQDIPARDILNYRILELMIGLKDDTMYALGTSSASHNVLLLEMPIPNQSEIRDVEELAQLDGLKSGDRVAMNLSEQDGESYILVVALGVGSRRMLYRIKLPWARDRSRTSI